MGTNTKPWDERKEVWGAALTTLSSALMLFPNGTIIYKVGLVIGVGLTAFGLKQGYQANNLPSGITSVMDNIPDSVTGVKGSNVK